MLSPQQLNQIIAENELLQQQLEEATALLSKTTQELEELKASTQNFAELRSTMELQREELHSIKNLLSQKQQQLEGALQRENDLQQDLFATAKMQQRYSDLVQEYAYTQTQLNDIKTQVLELNKRNVFLEQEVKKVGELESRLSLIVIERDELRSRLQ